MIISIYGLSGSGKSTLAKKLQNTLPNAIHIDLDDLNRRLMDSDGVKSTALLLFGEDVVNQSKLDSKVILTQIMQDISKYNLWTSYMIDVCNNFLQKYIKKTSFDYYILDHLNSHKLGNFPYNTIYIECILDKSARLLRLNKRENISETELNFRDQHYHPHTPDIIYTNDNFDEIVDKIRNV